MKIAEVSELLICVYNGIIALFCGLVLKGVQLRLK